MNEYHLPVPRQDNVRRAGQVSPMQSEPIAHAVKD
jgi:hypothetical protein